MSEKADGDWARNLHVITCTYEKTPYIEILHRGGTIMNRSFFAVAALVGMFMLAATGCVTKGYVNKRISALDNDIGQVRRDVAGLKDVAAEQDLQLRKHADTVQAALSRAQEAGKLAAGRLVCEATISDESVYFAFDRTALSDEAKASLNIFADVAKAQNRNIYIEIQGHTDNNGPGVHNLALGQARAEAVMRYLHVEQNIPLHRMNAFSYGDSRPVVENDTRGGRAKNRRVTILVME